MEQFIIFESNEQRFGLDIPQIEKVIEYEEIKKIPDSIKYILGYLQFDGKFLPVMDLKYRLYDVHTLPNEDNKIIIVKWKNGIMGLLVEKVIGINKFNEEDRREEDDNSFILKEYMHKLFSTEKGITIILDVEKIFTLIEEAEILRLKEESQE